jgi:hypothetical protein
MKRALRGGIGEPRHRRRACCGGGRVGRCSQAAARGTGGRARTGSAGRGDGCGGSAPQQRRRAGAPRNGAGDKPLHWAATADGCCRLGCHSGGGGSSSSGLTGGEAVTEQAKTVQA